MFQYLTKKLLAHAAAAMVIIWPYHAGFVQSKLALPIPCPVDRDDIVPLIKVMGSIYTYLCLFVSVPIDQQFHHSRTIG